MLFVLQLGGQLLVQWLQLLAVTTPRSVHLDQNICGNNGGGGGDGGRDDDCGVIK